MKAVILAAGEGSRMRPLSYTRPKVMLPVANKPILEHLLLELMKAGIKDLILIVGYHDEQVRNYFGNGEKWGASIEYVTQRKQLGTADAVRTVEHLVSGNFIMLTGDAVVNHKDIEQLSQFSTNTMSVIEVEDTSGLGLVEVEKDKVIRIYEKVDVPPTHTANAGFYMFTPEIFKAISQTLKSPRGEYEITDSLRLLNEWGLTLTYHRINYWLDLSYPWDLLKANETLLPEIEQVRLGEIEEHVVMKGLVSVGKGTNVRSGSYIVGPVIIGEDCDIGPNCYIRPHTAIGNGCHIGSAVEVKNSIIMNGSKVPHQNYVGDSVIGEERNLGAVTKLANLRLDKNLIKIGDKNTKRRKLGAIIGDKVETGVNSCINVGTLIGNNSQIGPGAKVAGIIAPDSKIY